MQKPLTNPALNGAEQSLQAADKLAKDCAARGDEGGHDAWQMVINALQIAVERACYAHHAMDWESVPEPRPSVLAGEQLVINAQGEAVAARRDVTGGRIIGIALNSAAPGETVSIAIGSPGGWQQTTNIKAGV